jgi:hypothetical protein
MNGLEVTVNRIAALGADATLADYVVKANDVIKWATNAVYYSTLTEYDRFTEYKNAAMFVDATTNTGIGTSTTAIRFVNGLAKASNTIDLSAKALEQLEAVEVNYALIGTSIRLENLAMRCRAKIDKDLFERCLSVLAKRRWCLSDEPADNNSFIAGIFVILVNIRIMEYMGIPVKQQVKDAFIKYIFNLDEDGVFGQQMIHKLIHLIQFPYLEIHQRVILPDQGDYILGSF